MTRLLSRRPSAAMIIALLALFVALGGSSYAAVKISARDINRGAVGTRAVANNSIRSGGHPQRDGVRSRRQGRLADQRRHRQQEPERADRTDGTDRADGSDRRHGRASHHRHEREHGEQRDERRQRRKLDGLDSTEFTRPACTSKTGALKGSVTIAASAAFSATFTPVAGYNCSGQSIEARRLSMGRYEVRFNGSPATEAVATAIVTGIKADMISVSNGGPGLFTVYVLDPLPAPGAFVDDSFTVITP